MMKRSLLVLVGLALALPSQALATDFHPEDEFQLHPWVSIHLGPLDMSINKAVAYLMIGTVLSILLGIVLVLFYVVGLPVILAKGLFKGYYERLGGPRYYVGAFLFLMMLSLPLKMLARWIFNLKYVVAIPEIFFNI